MELINIPGYILEEKVEIARRHLDSQRTEKSRTDQKAPALSEKTIEYIIDNYTRESGVRELDKQLAKDLPCHCHEGGTPGNL